MRSQYLPILACTVIVAALGALHGIATDRWSRSVSLQQSIESLSDIPFHFGDWDGEDMRVDDDLGRIGVQGFVHRRYRNKVTHEVVVTMIVCGRGGPICVHTPDVCYANAGYKQITAERRQEIESDRKDTFGVAQFGKTDAVLPSRLEIYWAWSRDGSLWQAPENPRLSLARLPALYKLYVIHEFVPNSRSGSSTSSLAFLKNALPVLRQTLPHAGL